jgi:hypothetical protein
MKSKFLLSVGLLITGSLFASVASACSCGSEPFLAPVTQQGGFAFAGNGNGAYFSWSNYTAPIIKITTSGTTTNVATTPGFYNGTENKNPNKFVFNYNMGLGSARKPDLQELQLILIAENFLPANTNKNVYDSAIREAVANFQKAHGIKPAPKYPYGYFGPITRGYVNSR